MIVESTEDVIIISGPMRANFWETIQTAVALTLKRHPTGVIVDCHQITELNEEGAETFQAAIDFVLDHEDARIIFVAVPEHVQEVMRHVPQVRSQMVVMDSIEDARQSMDLLQGADRPKKERKEVGRNILTVLCPLAFDPHVLEVSMELVSSMPAKVVLLMPIVVPREHPLQAHLPAFEEGAKLFAGQAKAMLEAKHVPFEIRLERTRELSEVVLETAEETNAAHVIVSIAASHEVDDVMANDFRTMLKKIDRPLIFVRGQVECISASGH